MFFSPVKRDKVTEARKQELNIKLELLEAKLKQEKATFIPYKYFDMPAGTVFNSGTGIKAVIINNDGNEIEMEAHYTTGAILKPHYHDCLEIIDDPDHIINLYGAHEIRGDMHIVQPGSIHSAWALKNGSIKVYLKNPWK